MWMQSCWFCFLLERSSSSGDSHGRLPGLGARPAGRAGIQMVDHKFCANIDA